MMLIRWDGDEALLSSQPDDVLLCLVHRTDSPRSHMIHTLSRRRDGKFIYRIPMAWQGSYEVKVTFVTPADETTAPMTLIGQMLL